MSVQKKKIGKTDNWFENSRPKTYNKLNAHPIYNRIDVQYQFIQELGDPEFSVELPKVDALFDRLKKIEDEYNQLVHDANLNELHIFTTYYIHQHRNKQLRQYKRLQNPELSQVSTYKHVEGKKLSNYYQIKLSAGVMDDLFTYLKENGYVDYETTSAMFQKIFSFTTIAKNERIIWNDRIGKYGIKNKSLLILLDLTLKKINFTKNHLKFIYANFTTPYGDFKKSLDVSNSVFKRDTALKDKMLQKFSSDIQNIIKKLIA